MNTEHACLLARALWTWLPAGLDLHHPELAVRMNGLQWLLIGTETFPKDFYWPVTALSVDVTCSVLLTPILYFWPDGWCTRRTSKGEHIRDHAKAMLLHASFQHQTESKHDRARQYLPITTSAYLPPIPITIHPVIRTDRIPLQTVGASSFFPLLIQTDLHCSLHEKRTM